jgi:hypothetical protein
MKLSPCKMLALAAMLGVFGLDANAAQVEEHSTWTSVAPANVQDAVDKSGKPQVVIVVDQNDCTACGTMLQQFIYAAGDYPGLKFSTGTPTEWGIPKELLPFVLVVTPHCGVTRRVPNYTPTSPEAIAYLVEHINDGAAMQPITRTCN